MSRHAGIGGRPGQGPSARQVWKTGSVMPLDLLLLPYSGPLLILRRRLQMGDPSSYLRHPTLWPERAQQPPPLPGPGDLAKARKGICAALPDRGASFPPGLPSCAPASPSPTSLILTAQKLGALAEESTQAGY